jgi:hypothetical protein
MRALGFFFLLLGWGPIIMFFVLGFLEGYYRLPGWLVNVWGIWLGLGLVFNIAAIYFFTS